MSASRTSRLVFRDLKRVRDEDLLEALYQRLFLPNFPDPNEQENPGDWIPRLWEQPVAPTPEQHAIVAGLCLDDPFTRSLAGFAFVEWYRASRCALLSYIAVDSHWRGLGLARTLFEVALGSAEQAHGGPFRAVFAEIHDPGRAHREGDIIDPAHRSQAMAHLGARLIPIRYVQPALGESQERSDRLVLIAFPQHGERTLDGVVIREFLIEYFAALAVPEGTNDPDLIRMTAELGSGPVDLVPLDTIQPDEHG